MTTHTHGRCDSTCPSYAHGCVNCPACAERWHRLMRAEGIDPDFDDTEEHTS